MGGAQGSRCTFPAYDPTCPLPPGIYISPTAGTSTPSAPCYSAKHFGAADQSFPASFPLTMRLSPAQFAQLGPPQDRGSSGASHTSTSGSGLCMGVSFPPGMSFALTLSLPCLPSSLGHLLTCLPHWQPPC